MSPEVFELELLGGSVERRYRHLRPEVEALPWGTLSPADYPPEAIDAARRAWTGAAFQEHRTGAACAATLRSMIEARAPLDLVALACRFPLDEMVHVELCARVAGELGGGAEIVYEPDRLVSDLGAGLPPLQRASHEVVAYFCVGEALSIPLLHATARACAHPLTRGVLERIVRDEADHGTFGWLWLDWVAPHLTRAERDGLAATAARAVAGVRANWDALRARPRVDDRHGVDLGWMYTDAYLELAERSLVRCVLDPLRERGLVVA